MAVTPVKIKERLKAKYPKANLSTKRLDAIAAKLATKPADDADDDAVDLVLEDFNGILSFEDIAKEDDRVRTLEANQKKPTDPPTTDPPKTEDAPKDVNEKLLEAISKLTSEVAEIKSGKVTETKKINAQTAFDKSEILKKLPDAVKQSWLGRIAVTPETTEEDIATQVTALETEAEGLNQHIANSYGYSGPPPSGGNDKSVDAKEITSIVDGLI